MFFFFWTDILKDHILFDIHNYLRGFFSSSLFISTWNLNLQEGAACYPLVTYWCALTVRTNHESVTTVKGSLFLILIGKSFVKSFLFFLRKCIYGTFYQTREPALHALFAFGVGIAGLSYVTGCVQSELTDPQSTTRTFLCP